MLLVFALMIIFVVLSYIMSEFTTRGKRESMSNAKKVAFDLIKMTLAILAGFCLANLIVGMESRQNFLIFAGISALIIDYATSIIYVVRHLLIASR